MAANNIFLPLFSSFLQMEGSNGSNRAPLWRTFLDKNFVQGDEFLFKIQAGFFLQSESNNRERRWSRVQNSYDHGFIFTVTKERKKSNDGHDYDRISAALHLIGSKSEANFSYSLKLTGHRHQLIWKATPLSINDNFHSAAKSNEYLVIESTDLGQKFSQNGYLDFEIKIERYSE